LKQNVLKIFSFILYGSLHDSVVGLESINVILFGVKDILLYSLAQAIFA
jgi:hypothetical protein